MLASVRKTRRLSLQLFAAALGAMAAVTVLEVPLALALEWWVVEDWITFGNLAVGVLAIVAALLLTRFDPGHAQQERIRMAAVFAVLATGAFALRFMSALDVIWVGFPARRAMHIVGTIGFDIVIALVAVVLVALTPGHSGTRVHALLRTGLGIVIAIAGLAVIASVAGFYAALAPDHVLGIMTRGLLGFGLAATALATLLAMRQVEDEQDVVDAF
ncbi:MAG: hypothetical protein CVU56_22125 [Deltaproteobacteria bacterium HGW-Deltaproteobacteria-14]|jgi:hypothetical protein|nr:MAG: hypothetical protein CVU56_22125 [Deltaproteobacteria bacterium HGW-Deltaproteobacteria-14]